MKLTLLHYANPDTGNEYIVLTEDDHRITTGDFRRENYRLVTMAEVTGPDLRQLPSDLPLSL